VCKVNRPVAYLYYFTEVDENIFYRQENVCTSLMKVVLKYINHMYQHVELTSGLLTRLKRDHFITLQTISYSVALLRNFTVIT
ncbi:hypothetical protein L9F63_000875, partial [Diploptera punctata]